MHRMGAQRAKVPDFEEFAESLIACEAAIQELWNFNITTIGENAAATVTGKAWWIISRLRASRSESRVVSGSKTLHHVLPALVPPIDREYTFRFFTGQTMLNGGEMRAFSEWFPLLCEIGRRCRGEIIGAVGRPGVMATSTSKVVDNAIVGFMRADGLAVAR
jgi:hypothetical protein